jgi:translation initiation factor 3 subunit I
LLFSASKDQHPTVWYSHNGERVGTYDGHKGSVFSLDVSYDSTRLVTGAADNQCILWDSQTGQSVWSVEVETAVRSVAFSLGDQYVAFVTDATMGHNGFLHVYSVNDHRKPVQKFEIHGKKPTVAVFANLNTSILSGHEDGSLQLRDFRNGNMTRSSKIHANTITDLQYSKDGLCFITSSKDHTARLFDSDDLQLLKCYKTDRPVNSASISPLREEVIVGGGQEAQEVTTTDMRSGKFEVKFFNQIYEQEIGRVKGHFGPINTVMYHPSGRGFASGGEDGYVRLHEFDPDYFSFKFEEE